MAVAAPIRFPSPATMSSSSMPGPSNFNHNFDHHPQPVSGSGPTPMFQPYYLRPAYRFKANNANDMSMMMMEGGPGRRLRKNVANVRRHIDYVAVVMNHMDARLWQNGVRDRVALQPDALYQNAMLPPASLKNCPVDCVLSKFVRAAMNKVKCPIYSLCWTPEGKRLITGASTGEFTLWNGTAFNFETILQAHDSAIRALRWSHNDQWLVSADHDGYLKYWQPNMNNVHMYQAHKNEPIRALSFAPTDIKLVTASDDGTARIWDFARCAEERVLRGHGSDVRSVDWHPQKGLIVTGSRDTQQPVKLWDPKSGTCLATLHDHKNSVMAVQWNRNGNWLLTASRDHLIKLYDIRIMREMHTYRGHKKEVTALAWHPVHEGLFVSGGGDGSLAYWLVHNEKEVGLLEHAHDQAVWTLEWHPLGHILASGTVTQSATVSRFSGSNDNNTKFWTRNRPGDTQEDIFGLASFTTTGIGAVLSGSTSSTDKDADKNKSDSGGPTAPVIPGMGLDADVRHGMNRDVGSGHHALPGLGGGPLLFPEDPNARGHPQSHIGAKRTLIKQPPPKRAQRQFERMWNVAKPGAGGDEFEYDDASGPMEEEEFRRPKTSLLGRRPRPDELPPLMDQQQPPEQMRPSYSPPPPGPGPMNPGGPNHWGPPPSLNMMPQAPFPQMPPPLPQLGPMWQLPPTGGGPPGSLPPPPLMGPPPGMMRMGPPQMPPMMNVGGPMPMNMMPPSMQMQDIDYRMGPPMMQQPGVSGHFNPGIMEMPPTSVGGGGDIDLRGGGGSWRTAPPLTAESSSDNAQAPPTSSTSRDPRRRETNQSQPVAAVGANDASTTSAQSVRDPRRRAVGSSRGS